METLDNISTVEQVLALSSDLRGAFLTELKSYMGTPYVWGGKTPNPGFDCSGYLTYCAQRVGVNLGNPNFTNANGIKQYCHNISSGEIQPGDLILFKKTYFPGGVDPETYATHCGVIENPSGGIMLDTHEPGGVQRTNFRARYWQERLLGFYRPNQL